MGVKALIIWTSGIVHFKKYSALALRRRPKGERREEEEELRSRLPGRARRGRLLICHEGYLGITISIPRVFK